MTPLFIAIAVIIEHFFFDWLLQSRYEAKNKSTQIEPLMVHATTIFIGAMLLFWIIGVGFWITLFWAALYATLHAIQDKFIYTGFTASPDIYENKSFWDRIAVDQALHLIIKFCIIAIAL